MKMFLITKNIAHWEIKKFWMISFWSDNTPLDAKKIANLLLESGLAHALSICELSFVSFVLYIITV